MLVILDYVSNAAMLDQEPTAQPCDRREAEKTIEKGKGNDGAMRLRGSSRVRKHRALTQAVFLVIALGAVACGSGDSKSPDVASDSSHVIAPMAPEVALRGALEALLRGSAELAATATWFSSTTAGALRSASVDTAGHATVDFEDLRKLIPNASSSAGSVMLLEELHAAVFSVEAVRSVDYLIEGRCELFWEWLQYSCRTVQRSE